MKVKPKKEYNVCQSCGKKTNKKVCNVCIGLVLKPIKEAEIKKKVETKLKKEALKTISDYRKELQTKINLIVRLIDLNHVCISCGQKPNKPFAGHYHAVGSNESLRYNLFNIFIQCMRCNGFNGGMLLNYGKGLTETFNNHIKEYCESTIVSEYKSIKLNQNDLIEASKKANQIIKFLKLENKQYNRVERINLRKQFNKMLGIYENT
jgi:hypothetical protein